MKIDWQVLIEWLKTLGVKLSQEQTKQFQTYHELLLKWNQKINLVSRKDACPARISQKETPQAKISYSPNHEPENRCGVDRLISYHFIDSVSSISEINNNSAVCDLGTGAGLPGIPVAIIRDDIKMYLVESITKKAYFLSEAVKTLELNNTIILNQRAETIQEIKFDVLLVRLFGKIPDVLPVASKLLSSKGKIIFYKIEGVEKEILLADKIRKKNNLILKSVKDITLPVTGIIRKLVIYERTR